MENPTLPTNWMAALSNANHVRKQEIGKNSLTSLRPAPSAAAFLALQRAFCAVFPSLGSAACLSKNFATKKFVMGLAFRTAEGYYYKKT